MDVRQLRYFQRIVAAGSISRAASELRVAQPALSAHIANLEAELGVQLLVRTKRGVQPTESGARLLDHARTILTQVERAIEDVSSSGRTPTGEVTLGLTGGAAAIVAPALLTHARARFPGIAVRIVDGLSGTLVEWVQGGRADMALVFDTGDLTGVDVEPVLWEEVSLVGAGIGAETVRPPELARVPLILPGRADATRQLAERYARSTGIELAVSYEADALSAIIGLLRSGIGCSLLAAVAVREEVRRGGFGVRPIDPKIERTVALIRPQGRPVTRAVDAVRNMVCDVVSELVQAGTWPGKLMLRHRPSRFDGHTEVEAIGF